MLSQPAAILLRVLKGFSQQRRPWQRLPDAVHVESGTSQFWRAEGTREKWRAKEKERAGKGKTAEKRESKKGNQKKTKGEKNWKTK